MTQVVGDCHSLVMCWPTSNFTSESMTGECSGFLLRGRAVLPQNSGGIATLAMGAPTRAAFARLSTRRVFPSLLPLTHLSPRPPSVCSKPALSRISFIVIRPKVLVHKSRSELAKGGLARKEQEQGNIIPFRSDEGILSTLGVSILGRSPYPARVAEVEAKDVDFVYFSNVNVVESGDDELNIQLN